MMTLLRNAFVVTVDNNNTVFPEGAVAIEGDTITYVGLEADLPSGEYQQVIDCKGGIVMPGLINTHTHNAMTLLRGRGTGLPLERWLEEAIYPIEDRMSEEDFYTGNLMGCAEMVLSGITCFHDMYFGMEQTIRAMQQVGMRGVLARAIIDIPVLGTRLEEAEDLILKCRDVGKGLIRGNVGPHAHYTNGKDTLIKSAELARKYGTTLHIHASETRYEVESCLKKTGKTPMAFFKDIGLLNVPTITAHCVHVTQDDVDIMAEQGVSVAHNVSSNLKLASGIAPIAAMLSKGVNVALGTDGCASNDKLDILEEMRTAALLVKGINEDPTLLSVDEAIRMATVNGALALGWSEDIGTLQVGKKADIIVIDTNSPAYQPKQFMKEHIVYSSGRGDVMLTMIAGEVVARDGKLTGMDLEEIKERYQASIYRLYEGGT